MNYRSFKDRERTLEELKSLFFFLAVFVYHLVISYHDFLALFSPSSLVFYHVYFLCIWERLTLLIISRLLTKKKKKNFHACGSQAPPQSWTNLDGCGA